MKVWAFFILFGCVYVWRQEITAAAITKSVESNADNSQKSGDQNEVQQLESLKSSTSINNGAVVTKTDTKSYNNAQGKIEVYSSKEERVTDADSGNVVANLKQDVIKTVDSPNSKPKTVTKTVLDIPSKGIHEVKYNKKSKVPSNNNEMSDRDPTSEDYYAYDGPQYTPEDMAEYILKTGDDEGVAMAIDELMREGLLSRNEAAAYLQEIKGELDYIQERYNDEQKLAQANLQMKKTFMDKETQWNNNLRPSPLLMGPQILNPSTSSPSLKSSSISNGKGTKIQKSKNERMKNMVEDFDDDDPLAEQREQISSRGMDAEEAEYTDLLERLRIANYLYKEYSLEEVIYQLAKEMFSQSLLRGSSDAEESLQRFSSFLQEETAKGRISKELKTKILEVMMAALVDALNVHPVEMESKVQSPPSNPLSSRMIHGSQDNVSEKYATALQEKASISSKSFGKSNPLDKQKGRETSPQVKQAMGLKAKP